VLTDSARILVVEDNDALRRGIATALRERWDDVDETDNGSAAVERIRSSKVTPFDVILTDLRLPGCDGVSVLRAARERDPATSVVVMTAHGTIETAVDAMRCGAFDFVEKPFDLEQLEWRVARGVDHRRLLSEVTELRAEKSARIAASEIIGNSSALCGALDLANRVAPTRSTVLVTGETGTGKELIAGLIHRASPRCDAPMVKVNCAALPETLLESELFGHERGAFTGADRQRIGRFEEASGGTLFLDEVGDMSPVLQGKLLRVLQDREVRPVGGTQTTKLDVRVLAATNKDLQSAIENGEFREDLYYRLNVIPIHIPPLRERPEDVPPLANAFVAKHSGNTRSISPEGLAHLSAFPWKGNARELENTVERALALSDELEITSEDFLLNPIAKQPQPTNLLHSAAKNRIPLSEVEDRYIEEVMQITGGNKVQAAKILGVDRKTLYRRAARKSNRA